jgi:hypothetical protein
MQFEKLLFALFAMFYFSSCGGATGTLSITGGTRNPASQAELPPIVSPPVDDGLPPIGNPGELYANYVAGPIFVNGNLADEAWAKTRALIVNNPNKSNNTMEVKILWNDEYLFLGYRIDDTSLEIEGGSVWSDDSVEFFLDTLNNRSSDFEADDAHALLAYTGRLFTEGRLTTSNINLGITAQSGFGYTVEIAVPWASLQVTPVKDKKMGLLLVNSDRDNAVCKSFDSMAISNAGGNYRVPNLYGTLILWK